MLRLLSAVRVPEGSPELLMTELGGVLSGTEILRVRSVSGCYEVEGLGFRATGSGSDVSMGCEDRRFEVPVTSESALFGCAI